MNGRLVNPPIQEVWWGSRICICLKLPCDAAGTTLHCFGEKGIPMERIPKERGQNRERPQLEHGCQPTWLRSFSASELSRLTKRQKIRLRS